MRLLQATLAGGNTIVTTYLGTYLRTLYAPKGSRYGALALPLDT